MTSIWIDDVVVGEQDGFANFVVRLDAPASAPVTVNYSNANSTAVAFSDYIPGSGTLTFAPGETVKTVPVQLVDDAVAEGTEVFTMNLSTPSANATIARKSATATIIDNDAPSGTPQVSISDLVVDEAAGTANFVVTFDRPSAGAVSMNYATQDGAPITGAGAAVAGQDYVAASGTLNFAPGETAKTVKVGLINDALPEGDEAFSLKLSGLVGATALNPVGTAVIGANDEPLVLRPAIWIDDVVVGEQDGFANFVVRLDAPASAPVTVNYSNANSTAVAFSDYIPGSGTLTFAPGETVKTVPVQLVDDAVAEGTEVFTMNLSTPSANATIARKSATATIIDNDAPSGTPQVSISDLVVDEAAGTANFVITFDKPSAGVVSMNYATQDGAPITGAGAALAGQDYVAASGTLNFAPGETAKTVKVGLINDALPEGDEAFSLKLSGLVGATALNPVGTAVIGANDEPLVLKPAISIDDVTVGEQDGFADFVIRLDAPASAPVTVNYSNANSTAVAFSDYIPGSGTLTFAPGETVKTVPVQLVDDSTQEGTEVFTMNLSSPSANATIARSSATATIIDNDEPSGTPQVSISDLVVNEAAGTANFVITFDKPSAGVVSIDYATEDGAPITGVGAAVHGSDYVAQSGTLNFAPGETAKTVKVGVIDDTLHEGPEAFRLVLSDLAGATSLDPVGTATITDNDPLVADILWQNASSGQAAIWDTNGGALVGGGTVSPNPGPSWKAIGTGDFNDDGHSDILWQSSSGQAAIWDMNGTNLIGGGTVSPNPGPSWKAIGTGDFNHDGHSDILWQNTSGQAAIWEINGTNIIGGGTVSANPGPSWKAIGTGDFNNDGHSDILWQNANGQAAIWEMSGNNIVGGGTVSSNPGPSWKAIGTGDFNDDGHSDILWQNVSGQVAIWEMNGNKIVGGGTLSADPGPSWHAIGTGGEGSSDILFQSTSGQTAIWDMNGTSIIGGGVVNPNPGPSWKAIGLT